MNSMELPNWPRAHGSPLFAARIRTVPQDFQVTEQLGWELSGDGEHDYLWIEKTGAKVSNIDSVYDPTSGVRDFDTFIQTQLKLINNREILIKVFDHLTHFF